MTYDEYIAQQQQAIDAERSPDGTGERPCPIRLRGIESVSM